MHCKYYNCIQAELEQAKQSQQNLEQVAISMVVAFGEWHPITVQYIQQSAESAKSDEQLVC